MSDANFLRLFPEQGGYSFFLLEVLQKPLPWQPVFWKSSFADFGFDVVSTSERLARFHRVENTYLSTFQTLAGSGWFWAH